MGASEKGQPQGIAPTVCDIIGTFKSLTTNEYIKFNPENWENDGEFMDL